MASDEPQKASQARNAFAAALREVRRRYGHESGQGEISQDEFAKMLGIHGDRPGERYGHYERATREPPIWLLAAVRRVTGYSLDELVADLPPGRRLEAISLTAPRPRQLTACVIPHPTAHGRK